MGSAEVDLEGALTSWRLELNVGELESIQATRHTVVLDGPARVVYSALLVQTHLIC